MRDSDTGGTELARLVERAHSLSSSGRRCILGITGAPGSGKSTLAEALQATLGPQSIVLPMDGFHLSKQELADLGRLQRMGAPDTFDAEGFVNLVTEISRAPAQTHRAPSFDRRAESAVPNDISITPQHRLVIVEGNYLLLDQDPWVSLRDLMDEIWFVDLAREQRLGRLITRHTAYGKTPEAARDWSLGPDETNARLIEVTRDRADLVVSLSPP